MDETPLFADDEACAAAIARVGELDRDLAKIETRKSRNAARVTAAAEALATPLQDERADLEQRIEAYCNEHRSRLTDGGRSKTATFTTGEACWRLGRARVTIDGVLKDKILERLKKLSGFTRTKVEIDVGAIAKALGEDRRAAVGKIAGVTFEPAAEAFAVKPTSCGLVARA